MTARLLQHLLELRNYVHSDQVPRLLSLLVLGLECVYLSVIVAGLVFIELLLLLESIIVLGKEPLRLVVNEVAQYFKAVALFDRLLFEQFCHYCDSGSDFVELCIPLLQACQRITKLR